ncbi:MAG: MFS transporter [Proteobacteria bacterium]|nr:MFS transporter [Pseudomonadota bacterium]
MSNRYMYTFVAITVFYFFELAQMSYFNVLAPFYLHEHIYSVNEIASISSAYYYGDMLGLIPCGILLDKYPLRKILLIAILGSTIGAMGLALSTSFYSEWFFRFLCGMFGGTFSFLGGIRILVNLFNARFSFYIGIFLAAGMSGSLICQYPLLLLVENFGIFSAMYSMAIFSILVLVINLIYLHPQPEKQSNKLLAQLTWSNLKLIFKNYKNWTDCIMVIFLDTPISIIATLWGVVLLSQIYGFSSVTSSVLVMLMLLGCVIGSPMWGYWGDKYGFSPKLVFMGSSVSLICLLLMLTATQNLFFVSSLIFTLGLSSSCQTLGFTWLTKNMRSDQIGLNSAINSILFMSTNGLFKQVGAILIGMPPLLFFTRGSIVNILYFMILGFILSTLYVLRLARSGSSS